MVVCHCATRFVGKKISTGYRPYLNQFSLQSGEEKGKIERGNSPIYGLAWNPATPASNGDILTIVDWNQTLSFYSTTGQTVGKERTLGFDPLCLSYFPCGEFLLVSGCNKIIQLFSRDGVRLGQLGEQHDSWIWSVAVHPYGNSIVRFSILFPSHLSRRFFFSRSLAAKMVP
jgi:intraflagellar transport protein 122